MNGEFLTHVTIWIAIVAYAVGAALIPLTRARPKLEAIARLIWTLACVSLLVHVASAFHFYHQWSHDEAYFDTARQTYETVGVNWGGGIYFNYALMLLWILDVTSWWVGGLEGYRRRPLRLTIVWHGFLFFMFFNATVVFGSGLVRWLGLLVCTSLCVIWWIALQQRASGGINHSMQDSDR